MMITEFETYFRRLFLPLGMFAMRIVDNADNAEDIVENAFLKAWQRISEGVEIENFNAYMYRCVRNECVSFLRGVQEFEDIDSIPEISEEIIDTSERDARIWKAIDSCLRNAVKSFL